MSISYKTIFNTVISISFYFLSVSIKSQEIIDQSNVKIYHHHKTYFKVFVDHTKRLMISKSCSKDITPFSKCQAAKSLFNVKLSDIKNKRVGGKNPGSLLCKYSTDGEVIFAKDLKGRNTTFCQFQDKSMVASHTLYYFASKNKEQRK